MRRFFGGLSTLSIWKTRKNVDNCHETGGKRAVPKKGRDEQIVYFNARCSAVIAGRGIRAIAEKTAPRYDG